MLDRTMPNDVAAAFKALQDDGHLSRMSLSDALDVYLGWLVPEWCEGIRPEFWETFEGQVVAEAQWTLHEGEALSLSEAAALLGRPGTTGIMFVRDRLPLYRRPDSNFHQRRAGSRGATSRAYYVLRADVEALRESVV